MALVLMSIGWLGVAAISAAWILRGRADLDVLWYIVPPGFFVTYSVSKMYQLVHDQRRKIKLLQEMLRNATQNAAEEAERKNNLA